MSKKYLFGVIFMPLAMVVVMVVSCSPIGRPAGYRSARAPIFDRSASAVGASEAQESVKDTTLLTRTSEAIASIHTIDSLLDATPLNSDHISDSTVLAHIDPTLAARDTTLAMRVDSIAPALADSTLIVGKSVAGSDSITVRGPRRRDKPFLEAPVSAQAVDSIIYDRRRNLLFHYNQGDLTYEDLELKGDYIVMDVSTKELFGTGVTDSFGTRSRLEFSQGGTNYTMDTVRYNLDTRKALVQGVATKDGEGYMLARRMKRMPDGTMNGEMLGYTTCDRIDHPHFYIAMTKARVIPGKKVITGPAYFVMEDVPIYFLGVPGGFFPISVGPTAGILMPEYGEEANRGFYLRGGGYYFTFGDHLDLSLTGDLYTLGSWGISAASRYIKRYKFSGGLSATYNKLKMGDPNPQNSSTFSLTWNHTQDPKANPRQNFSANVNFSTAGQKQLATTSLQDHLNTNTNSSISYSRNWDIGPTTLNLTMAMNLSTSSRDSVISMTLPNVSLSIGSFAPFKRRAERAFGKQRWYEKITMDYSMQAQNSTGSVKERDFFTKQTLRDLQNGVSHRIGVKTSLNLWNNLNFSPSFSYQESWNFKKQRRVWDPTGGRNGQGELASITDPTADNYVPPEFGFYRTYSWSVSGALSTKLYGVFEVKRKPGKTGWLQAIRHMVTPTLGFSYSPDFRHPRYGFYEYVQNSPTGGILEYIPVQGSPRVSPGGPSASINGSLSNQVEIKVKSRRDSVGVKKITIIEQFALNGISWNFLADSMNLSNINISLRTGEIFKGFALQLSGTWTPYQYVQVGNGMKQIRKLAIGNGKFGRITNTSWSFGKTFNSPNSAAPDPNSINGRFVNPYDPYDFSNSMLPIDRRAQMVAAWYDFRVPWSFTFNYNVNYQYTTTLRPVITQNLGFNGNINLTEKWGFHFESGYDFTRRKLSHMQFSLIRDLHCWEMSFQWVPMGYTKMYSFHIGIKSGMLRDIKYDKSSNAYDNLAW